MILVHRVSSRHVSQAVSNGCIRFAADLLSTPLEIELLRRFLQKAALSVQSRSVARYIVAYYSLYGPRNRNSSGLRDLSLDHAEMEVLCIATRTKAIPR